MTAVKGTPWSTAETKNLIALMGDFIKDNEEMPTTMVELERRIKNGKGKKKNLWKDFAELLSCKFDRTFDFKQVARKWQTLVDGYKKAVDNNKSTGRGPSKFAWFDEMNELIGGRHDINLVVTGTQNGIIIHRPNQVRAENVPEECEEKPSQAVDLTEETTPVSIRGQGKMPSRKRKHEEAEDVNMNTLLQFFKESEEKSLEIEQKMLRELSELSTNMTSLMKKMIEKM